MKRENHRMASMIYVGCAIFFAIVAFYGFKGWLDPAYKAAEWNVYFFQIPPEQRPEYAGYYALFGWTWVVQAIGATVLVAISVFAAKFPERFILTVERLANRMGIEE